MVILYECESFPPTVWVFFRQRSTCNRSDSRWSRHALDAKRRRSRRKRRRWNPLKRSRGWIQAGGAVQRVRVPAIESNSTGVYVILLLLTHCSSSQYVGPVEDCRSKKKKKWKGKKKKNTNAVVNNTRNEWKRRFLRPWRNTAEQSGKQ